jgi:hypothetical protein
MICEKSLRDTEKRVIDLNSAAEISWIRLFNLKQQKKLFSLVCVIFLQIPSR